MMLSPAPVFDPSLLRVLLWRRAQHDQSNALRSVQILTVTPDSMVSYIVLAAVVGLTVFLRATGELETED